MTSVSLFRTLGKLLFTVELPKLQAAVFLARRASSGDERFGARLNYGFAVDRGRVRSDELSVDWAFLRSVQDAVEPLETDEKEFVYLRNSINHLLAEEPMALEAAATQVFFREEHLGDPSGKLRWYRDLDGAVLAKASQIEMEVSSGVLGHASER